MSWLTRFPPRRGAVHHFPAKANHPHSVITVGSKLAPASSHRCDDRWKYYGEEVGLVARRKMVIPRCVIWPISVARIVPRDERASVQMTAASSGFIAIIYRRRNWRLAGSRQKRWFLQMHRILGDYYTARYWVLTVQSQYRMSLRLAKWTVVILQKETLSKLLSANTVTKKQCKWNNSTSALHAITGYKIDDFVFRRPLKNPQCKTKFVFDIQVLSSEMLSKYSAHR